MADIDSYQPRTGRLIKEDGSIVNEADYLAGPATVKHVAAVVAFDGAGDPAGPGEENAVDVVFVVTGEVEVLRIIPKCTEALAGATATVSLGVDGDTDAFLAATTATDIDGEEYWLSDSGSEAAPFAVPAELKDRVIDTDIVLETLTADIESGALRFDVLWRPISEGATLAAVEA